MKNFEINFPVEGSNALKPAYKEMPRKTGRIIAFPSVDSTKPSLEYQVLSTYADLNQQSIDINDEEMPVSLKELLFAPLEIQSDKKMSLSGKSFGCISSTHSLVAFTIFCLIVGAIMFIGV